jgi:hypothetical protein
VVRKIVRLAFPWGGRGKDSEPADKPVEVIDAVAESVVDVTEPASNGDSATAERELVLVP